ncbi:MAG: glycosyltransferase family 2 protein, partial [Anaerolineales bacterium]
MAETRPLLSLVVPAYNEGAPERLPQSLRDIRAFVEAQSFDTEVIIVNNNSTDATLEIAQQAAQ